MTSDSARTTTGWIVFIAAMGMMFGLLSGEVVALKSWNDMTTPLFVGTTMGHIAATITAFVGGRLIPDTRDPHGRSTDDKG